MWVCCRLKDEQADLLFAGDPARCDTVKPSSHAVTRFVGDRHGREGDDRGASLGDPQHICGSAARCRLSSNQAR